MTDEVSDPIPCSCPTDDAHQLALLQKDERIADLEDALRAVAFSLGVGGYNAETVNISHFREKINFGIDFFVRCEVARMHTLHIAKMKRAYIILAASAAIWLVVFSVFIFSHWRVS